jgi:miniconductance mechanosensitive channel
MPNWPAGGSDLARTILWLLGFEQPNGTRTVGSYITSLVLALAITATVYIVVRFLLAHVLVKIVRKSNPDLADSLLTSGILYRIAYLAPALVIFWLIPAALGGRERFLALFMPAVRIYMIVVTVLILNAGLTVLLELWSRREASKKYPGKLFVQVAQIVILLIAGLLILSHLLGTSPIYLLTAAGAVAAIVGLIFKDPIMGFVAGVQVVANKMVAIGDWVEVSQYGAEGFVLEINITTMKVRNWDNTISTVPTYSLVSQSFKNWHAMETAGARRIKRAVYINMHTVKPCSREIVETVSAVPLVQSYLTQLQEASRSHPALPLDPLVDAASSTGLTNLAVFRTYLLAYLKNHPGIRQDMILIVRHLDPTPVGLPVEIIAHCQYTALVDFEAVQSEIFEHILSILPQFGLEVYQTLARTELGLDVGS